MEYLNKMVTVMLRNMKMVELNQMVLERVGALYLDFLSETRSPCDK